MRAAATAIALLLLLAFTFREDTAYPQGYFSRPVAEELRLSGAFGELRPGHFHGGIDVKGKVGQPLFAAAEGYVSRITVSPNGYGKAVYLAHPNGFQTLYAHMDRFNPELEAYVKGHQYAEQSYSVDLRPGPGQFAFEKGERIGFMGMTGYSLGPHLHFEVQDKEEKLLINPLNFGLPVADHRAPVMKRLRLYAIDERGGPSPVEDRLARAHGPGFYRLPGSDTLYTRAALTGLGLEVFDQQDAASNQNGIYTLKLFQGDSLLFFFHMQHFLREETRYLDAHLDYAALQKEGAYIHRCYRMPGNALSNYEKEESVLRLKPGEAAALRLEAADKAGNTAVLSFWLKRIPGEVEARRLFYNYLLPWDEASIVQTPTLYLHFPDSCFYEDFYLHYEPVLEDSYGVYSLVHHIEGPPTPVRQPFAIAIRPTLLIPDELMRKAFVACCESGGAIVNCGGKWKEGALHAEARAFGPYCIMADDVPPSIQPLNFRQDLSRAASLAFQISDNVEGQTLEYRGTIDGMWVLFEYDAKNRRLEHLFEDTLAPGEHQLRLEVKDAMGNVGVFERGFRR